MSKNSERATPAVVQVRTTQEVRQMVNELAARDERSLSAYVSRLIRREWQETMGGCEGNPAQ